MNKQDIIEGYKLGYCGMCGTREQHTKIRRISTDKKYYFCHRCKNMKKNI